MRTRLDRPHVLHAAHGDGETAPKTMSSRRLAPVLAGLRSPAGAAAASEPAVEQAPAEPRGASHPGALSAGELNSFLVNGYLIVPVDELGPAFHDKLYTKCCDSESGYRVGESDALVKEKFSWGETIPEITDVVASPTVSGALQSLLGPDCVMHPHRHMHTSMTRGDQGFHKDGHHIPVRDHRPRWMMGLYFANEVTVDMGPTCIVPESQYYEVDRLHWSTLGTHKEPPTLTTNPGRESWEAECSRVGQVMASADPAARDQMIERTGTFFGREQKKCTVPAGSMVFIHFDILHRGSRQAFEQAADLAMKGPDTSVSFRPMYKLQFFRATSPAATAALPASDWPLAEDGPATTFPATGAPGVRRFRSNAIAKCPQCLAAAKSCGARRAPAGGVAGDGPVDGRWPGDFEPAAWRRRGRGGRGSRDHAGRGD